MTYLPHLFTSLFDLFYSSTRADTVCNSISSLHGALGSTASQEGISISQYAELLESIQL